jgi:hypothetical protein
LDKTLEYIHLMHFKDIFPDFPEGDVCECEKPDFIVHCVGGQKTIGIEHTQIFKPDHTNKTTLKAQDELGKKVAQRARCIYLKNHNIPLIVTISPMPGIEIKKANIENIAGKVVNVIENTNIKVGEPICIRPLGSFSDIFPKEIGRLYLFTFKDQKDDLWNWSGSGWYFDMNPEFIQDQIDKKENKLAIYKSNCDTEWLLLVADDSRNPSFLEITDSIFKHTYKTKFDRVFIFWNASKRFVELQLEH